MMQYEVNDWFYEQTDMMQFATFVLLYVPSRDVISIFVVAFYGDV